MKTTPLYRCGQFCHYKTIDADFFKLMSAQQADRRVLWRGDKRDGVQGAVELMLTQNLN